MSAARVIDFTRNVLKSSPQEPSFKADRRKPPQRVTVAPEDKLLVSREEAAQMLSISQRELDYLVASKRLPTRRIGGRVLIPLADLRKYACCDHPQRIVSAEFIIVDVITYYVHNNKRKRRFINMESLPIPIKNAMRKLGSDIRIARLRRRIPVAVMAQRAFISRTTLVKLEKGDPGVAMGTYAAVLFAFGMIDRLGELASAKSDEVGLVLDEERLPKRIEIRPRRMTTAPARK